MTFEDIAAAAAQGQTRTQVAQAMGVRRDKFRLILEVLPHIDWPADAAKLDNMREKVRERWRVTVRGVRGTVPELVKHFGLSISVRAVNRRRLEHGDIERALFDPVEPLLVSARKAHEKKKALNKALTK